MSDTNNKTAGVLDGEMITDEDASGPYIVCFAFRYTSVDGVNIEFSIDPTPAKAIEWLALVDAIKTNQKYGFRMSSEGDVSVGHADGQVKFFVNGNTCDGNPKVTLPTPKCVAALEKCALAYAAHDAALTATCH